LLTGNSLHQVLAREGYQRERSVRHAGIIQQSMSPRGSRDQPWRNMRASYELVLTLGFLMDAGTRSWGPYFLTSVLVSSCRVNLVPSSSFQTFKFKSPRRVWPMIICAHVNPEVHRSTLQPPPRRTCMEND